jgi:hypothetical protein
MSEDTDRFFAGGPSAEMRNGRYTYPDPVTGAARTWQSASNFAYPLVDQYGLNVWRHRQLLIGLSRRPDLLDLLRAMVDPESEPSKLDEMVTTAFEVAGTQVKANLGTIVHEVVRAVNLGRPYPPEHEDTAENYRRALRDYGLRVVATERRVVNPAVGACGQFDVLFEESDGTMVTGDVKTAGNLDRAAHEFAVQLAVYQGATHVRSEDDRSWASLDGVRIRDDYAVVVHIDRDTGAVALYRVDLLVGRHGINLAERVRGWRKSGPVLLPYVPPAPPVGPALAASVDLSPDPAWAPPMIGETRVHGAWVQQWNGSEWLTTGPATPTDRAEQASDEAAQAYPLAGNEGHGPAELSDGTEVSTAPGSPPLRSADDLMRPKVTKAEVQQYAREHGLTDLAHTKKVLVEMLGAAGKLAADGATLPVAKPSGDPAELPGAVPGLSDPTNPHDPAFRTTVLSKIRQASSVAVLGEIWSYVKRQGGDQAWSDEMAEAGRARAAELDAQVNTTDTGPAQRAEAEGWSLIQAAKSSHDLAQTWETVTVGGSAKERWTDALNHAAQARLAEIQAAAPPAPANPFAGAQ